VQLRGVALVVLYREHAGSVGNFVRRQRGYTGISNRSDRATYSGSNA
jgi:hypothetical protein